MSQSTDPNVEAARLALLSKQLAEAAGRDATKTRNTILKEPAPWQNYEDGGQDQALQGADEDTDQISAPSDVPSQDTTGYAPQVASWVSSTYGAHRPEPHVIIKGAKFSSKAPRREDVRTEKVIVARSVDLGRDQKAGVPISRYNLNYVFADPDEKDHLFTELFGKPDPNYLPATTDLRDRWGDIFDQLDLGSCVSNSVAYTLRYCFKKEKLGDFTPSRLFIYYNGRQVGGYPLDEDSGLTIRDGYKSVGKFSTCGDNLWPYDPNAFAKQPPEACYKAAKEHATFRYIRLDNDLAQIKKCLKDQYPISFGAALFSSFMSAETARTGVVPLPDINKDERIGGHAMTIVGHDDSKDAFLVANNWGEDWGEKGFCWFPYEYMVNDDFVSDLWSPRWFS